mgnify:FL=1
MIAAARLPTRSEPAAEMYSLIGTATLSGLDPEACLRDVLTRIAEHPINWITKLDRGAPALEPQPCQDPSQSRLT